MKTKDDGIYIVLDVSDGCSPVFVDIENEYYSSVQIGEKIQNYAGKENLMAIRITVKDIMEAE